MKKDDIIKQKLFETTNLSQFYLDYIINCKWDDESPLLLANAYKQKLFEIVDRYDRMLDSSKQREQLCLAFEKAQAKPPRYLQTPTSLSKTRTSTPSKGFSKSNCSSYASTPTTPCQPRTFVRSSSSSSSASFTLNNTQRTNTKSSPYSATSTRSYLNLAYSNKSSKTHSKLELEQRIASIYYDDYEDENETENVYEEEEEEEIEEEMVEVNTKLAFNDPEYSETDTDFQIDELDSTTNRSQVIEKSYSNLSKDSGVLVDSYHSDYSNCIFSGVGCLNTSQSNLNEESKLQITVNKNLINDLTSPRPLEVEQEEPEQDQEENSISQSSNEEEDEVTTSKNSLEQSCVYKSHEEDKMRQFTYPNLSLKKIFNSKVQNRAQAQGCIGLLNNFQNYRTYTKNMLQSKKLNKRELNLDLNLDYTDASNLMSLLMESSSAGGEVKNTNLVNQLNDSSLSICSSMSTPSPSSTTSSSSSSSSSSSNVCNSPSLIKSTHPQNPLFLTTIR